MLFYADDDTAQGDQHTNFKLSTDGESVALFGADGVTQIDAVTRSQPKRLTLAYGRQTDGTGSWAMLCEATPSGANADSCSNADSYIYLPVVMTSEE